jgi:NTP pyrophosphatase (non-canonical NTP hydrolase)
MALAGEVGELTEIFQWLTPEQSATVLADPARATQVREEIADIFAYLLRLADVLGVDLEASLLDKTAKNAAKYPVETRDVTRAVRSESLPGTAVQVRRGR